MLQQQRTLTPQDYQETVKGFNEMNQMRTLINQPNQQMNRLPRISWALTNNYVQEQYNEMSLYRNQLELQISSGVRDDQSAQEPAVRPEVER